MLGHLKKTVRYRRNGNIKGGSPPSINCGGVCPPRSPGERALLHNHTLELICERFINLNLRSLSI
jgi:hypothetical protein